MGRLFRYLTHPQVRIDPATPVDRWTLSEEGRRRARAMRSASFMDGLSRIVASEEPKAQETAAILAGGRGLRVETRPRMGENDRSATGFLPPPEFERAADRFFAQPAASFRGWETALDAQARIVREVETTLEDGGTVLFVGHGAVGTLLLCAWGGLPIERRHDQPAGGGHLFEAEIDPRAIRHSWRRAEDL